MGKKNETLPDFCYHAMPDDEARVVLIVNGDSGYRPYHTANSPALGKALADRLNMAMDVTDKQREAMFAGSMFGWHVPLIDKLLEA